MMEVHMSGAMPVLASVVQEEAVPGAGGTGQPAGGDAGGGGATRAPGGAFDPFTLMIPLLVIFFLMILMTGRREKKERKRKEEMLSSLARNDRVQTLGGMLGTVVEVKGDQVRLRVDETTKTCIWFSKQSIQQVVRKAGSPEGSDEAVGSGAEARA